MLDLVQGLWDAALNMGGWGIALIFLCVLVALMAGVIIGPLMMLLGVIALVVTAVGTLAVDNIQFSFAAPFLSIVAGAVMSIVSLLFWRFIDEI